MPIPDYRADGYLPEGVHLASDEEILFRFASGPRHRRLLAVRLRRWLELARAVGAVRLLIDGSFVTAMSVPNDLGCRGTAAPGF